MTAQEKMVTAASLGLGLCKSCHLVQPCPEIHGVHCERCGAAVHIRKPYSVQLSWFFLVLAMLLLIPANILPMMDIRMFDRGDPSTIIGGVALLIHHKMYPIAAVVFIASFVVPLGKIASIIILLLSVQFRSQISAQRRTTMYRVVEFLGRWSMLDVFVVTVMVGLVQLGQTISVVAGMGIVAFGAAVILTMLSSISFDPRLIWDSVPQDR